MTLTVHNLSKDYPTPSGPLSILRNVHLEMQTAEALAVMGPSGSGKSTLLHIMGTLDTPTSGEVRLDQINPFALSEGELARFRNRRIGFIFQDHYLLPQCTVLENVLIPTLVNPDKQSETVEAYARELLERVGLGERLTHRPAELSGGERQRVAVARALIHRPALLLADEPTGNLDRATARTIGELLQGLPATHGSMLVVVTHSRELADYFPRRLAMVDGSLKETNGSSEG